MAKKPFEFSPEFMKEVSKDVKINAEEKARLKEVFEEHTKVKQDKKMTNVCTCEDCTKYRKFYLTKE